MIIEEKIKHMLTYKDGFLFWNNRTGKMAHLNGRQAGSYDSHGYLKVTVNHKVFAVHRVVFFLHYGWWPKQIDHKNRVRDDNRIENLRPCNYSGNRVNSKDSSNQSVYGKNISKHKITGKYKVELSNLNKKIYFGYYDDLELAQLVASEARKKYYGEFA